MSWFLSFGLAFFTALTGMVCGWMLGIVTTGPFRISARDGGAAYYALLLAFAGFLAGGFAGLLFSRMQAMSTDPSFLKAAGQSFGFVFGVSLIVLAIAFMKAELPASMDGQEVELLVEFRLPAGAPDPHAFPEIEHSFHLENTARWFPGRNQRKYGAASLTDARFENGQWIVPARMRLYTRSPRRTIGIVSQADKAYGFELDMPGNPRQENLNWSDWLPRSRPDGSPWPETRASYRFKVEKIAPPPPRVPEPDPEIARAEAFAQLKTDAPLHEWLSFLTHDAPAERREKVAAVLLDRHAELARAIRGRDAELAAWAVGAIADLPQVPPDVLAALRHEAGQIERQIGTFQLKQEEDGYGTEGDRIRSRYNNWHGAWWAAQQKAGFDGRPELQAILRAARKRSDDGFLQEVIVNAEAQLERLNEPAAK